MKITKQQLHRLIQEELENVMAEQTLPPWCHPAHPCQPKIPEATLSNVNNILKKDGWIINAVEYGPDKPPGRWGHYTVDEHVVTHPVTPEPEPDPNK
jgi:hypothetical protein